MRDDTRLKSFILRSRLRPILLAGVVVFIVLEIVALSPSSLEQVEQAPAPLDPQTVIQEEQDGPMLATGIPKNRIAEYSVDQFNYVSTENGEKQWKLVAQKAFLYDKEKLVHARGVTAYLYDPEGKITVITGLEAKYFMNQRDLELFGQVHAVMPDGFEINSEYLRYKPNLGMITIPVSYEVHGKSGAAPVVDGVPPPSPSPSAEHHISFTSRGLLFDMKNGKITLEQTAHLTMEGENATAIDSDRCVIDRVRQIAHFTMSPGRPLRTRFVQIHQPTLYTHSRRADLNYGDFSQILNYLVAYDDVLIKEKPEADPKPGPRSEPKSEDELRYGTSGRADFDAKKDLVVLTDYPQVYQGGDTVTGDIIVLHRDTDIVEVEHSNAFSQGEQ